MEHMDIKTELEARWAYLESLGYHVIYMGLYGSQNYNLDTESSDIDVKAVVVQPLRELIKGKSVSISIPFETGLIDVKDLVSFAAILEKGNVSYIESVNTAYCKVVNDELLAYFRMFEVNPKSIMGMCKEKEKALEKGLPKSSPSVAAFGYDPKQYCNIIRLTQILSHLMESNSMAYDPKYSYFETGSEKQIYLLKTKQEDLGYDRVLESARCLIESYDVLLEKWLENRKRKEIGLDYVYKFLEQHYTKILAS